MHRTHRPRTLLRLPRRPVAAAAAALTAVALWSGVAGALPQPGPNPADPAPVAAALVAAAPAAEQTVPTTQPLLAVTMPTGTSSEPVLVVINPNDAASNLLLTLLGPIFGNRWTITTLPGFGNRWGGSGW